MNLIRQVFSPRNQSDSSSFDLTADSDSEEDRMRRRKMVNISKRRSDGREQMKLD
jgi:hypothetical protein